MILVPRPFSILQIQRICIIFQVFTRHPLLLQWEWCHLPLLQRLQLMLPHLVLIEQAVSRLFSICKYCGNGNCEKATVGSRGDHRQQGGPSAAGGTRYGGDIWSGGTDYSAVDSPGGPLSRGECPRCDRSTALQTEFRQTPLQQRREIFGGGLLPVAIGLQSRHILSQS